MSLEIKIAIEEESNKGTRKQSARSCKTKRASGQAIAKNGTCHRHIVPFAIAVLCNCVASFY